MTKVDLNQVVIEQPTYIVISMGWRDNLILPIIEGLEYLKVGASGIRIEGDLNPERDKPLKLYEGGKEQKIFFMTETQLKKIKMEMLVDPHESD